MTMKTVSVSSLSPNPFRELDDYPIDREKVEALKESIGSTGFWGTIVARKKGAKHQIAFGHHRMVALQELGSKRCEIIIRDLSNEDMVQMMARENLEEYGTNAYIEAQTVESTIRAYGRGEIEIPEPDPKTNQKHIRHAQRGSSEHPYTMQTIANFLGWVGSDGQPNHCCRVAFHTVDAFMEGIVTRKQLRGVKRDVAKEICGKAMAIKREQERIASEKRRKAEQATRLAEMPENKQHARTLKRHADKFASEADQAEATAVNVAKKFAKDAVKETKAGKWSQRDVREAGAEEKAKLRSRAERRYREAKEHYDALSRRISKMLNETVDDEFKSLVSLLSMDCGLEPHHISVMLEEVEALRKRAEKFAKKLRAWEPPRNAGQVDSQLRIVG